MKHRNTLDARNRVGRSLALIVLALGLPLVVAACRWQVPADPGLNFAQRTREPAVERGLTAPPTREEITNARQDPQALALYRNHCGRCHAPFDPRSVSAAQWPMYVKKYAPRAGLFGADRAKVLAWLQANAQ